MAEFQLNSAKGEPHFSVLSFAFDFSCSFCGEIGQKAFRKLNSVFLLPFVAYVENL